MKINYLLLFFMICLNLNISSEDKNIIFNFGIFVNSKESDNIPMSKDIKDDIMISEKTTLKFEFEPLSEVYLYLIYYDTEGYLNIIIPEKSENTVFEINKKYLFPENDDFSLGGKISKGKQLIYLIASSQKLLILEKKTKDFKKLSETLSTKDNDQVIAMNDVLNEINDLKMNFNDYYVLSEKPLTDGFKLRTSKVNPRNFIYRIDAKNFYFKIINLQVVK
jgi:hypothetical protein